MNGRASQAGSSQPRRAGERRARPVASFPAGPPAIGPGHNPDPAPTDSKRGGRARCPTAPHGSVLSPRRAMLRAGRRYLLVRRRMITPPATSATAARATPPTRTKVLSPVCASPPPEPESSVPVSVPSSVPGVVGSSPFYAHRPAGPPRRRRPDGTKRPRPRMNG